MPNGQPKPPSIVGLVKSASADAKKLATAQAQLLQAEMKQTGQQAGITGGLFIGAAVLGFLGFVFVLVTLAWVLVALGLPYWAGFGIVALLLLIVAAVLGLVGKKKAEGIKGPQIAMAELEKTKAVLAGPPPGAVVDSAATVTAVAQPGSSLAGPGA